MQTRHTVRSALAVALAAFALLLGGLAAPATAAGSATVKGVVSLDGKPVRNAKVQLYMHQRSDSDDVAYAYDRVKTVSTDKSGRYSFKGVKAGTWKGDSKYVYAVLVTDRAGKGAKALKYFTTKKPRNKTIDVTLDRAVILTGSIARSDGGSPAELMVNLSSNETRNDTDPLNPEFRSDSATAVRADGTFTVKGQPAGEYQLVVKTDAYLDHCYDFTTQALAPCDSRAGEDVVLKAGERRVLAPAVMTNLAPPVSTVTGTVTDPSGRPLKGIEMKLRQVGGNVIGEPAVTRSNGRFTYRGRPAQGEYLVRYTDPKNIWRLDGAGDAVAGRITITPGQTVGGIDAKLKSVAAAKHTLKGGKGTAKLAFDITRKAGGSKPGGTLTISYKGNSKTVTVRKGKATAILKGLRAGTRAIVVEYSGTATTAGFSKRLNVKVK